VKTARASTLPHVRAFEILSPSDTPERWSFEEKLDRYRALGVRELVTFHVDGAVGHRLRVRDRIDHGLVERGSDQALTPSERLAELLE